MRLALILSLVLAASASAAPVTSRVQRTGPWLTDAKGRVVTFHGVNVLKKVAPYVRTGFGAKDARLLADEGFTVARIGFIWAGAEPRPGVYDDAYIGRVLKLDRLLARYGIRTLIDFHQDSWSQANGGDGAPAWATLGTSADASFAAFWRDDQKIQTRFVALWKHIAKRLKGHRNIIGLDPFNEPYPGTDYAAPCSDFTPCPAFESGALATFTRRVIAAIRAGGAKQVIFPEAVADSGYATPALPRFADAQTAYQFHFYCLGTQVDPREVPVDEFAPEAAACLPIEQHNLGIYHDYLHALGVPGFLGEFSCNDVNPDNAQVIDLADAAFDSWTIWAYYTAADDPADCPGQGLAVDDAKPGLKPLKLDAIAVPYAQAVAGTPVSTSLDRTTHTFTLTYDARPGVTQVFVPARMYPDGYAVRGAKVVSKPGSPWARVRARRGRVTVTIMPAHGVKTRRPSQTGAFPMPRSAAAATPIYRDTHYTPAERAADLVSRMTLDEKAAQLSTTNAPAIPRLGVSEYAYWSEAQHGLSAFYGGNMTDPSRVTTPRGTSFPTNLSASLTWDPALIRRETSAISDEARGALDKSLFADNEQNNLGPSASDYGNLFYWAPTVNLTRDPRWGRNDEPFGEDPFLVGTLASAWVQGFQGENARGRLKDHYLKAVSTEKHFALNNVEHNRMGISSDTDEATIRDYYTAQFRRVIEHAHVAGIMSSYNAINGTPAVTDDLTLNVLLRRTFGFDGYVTSDCGAVGTTYRRPDGVGTTAGSLPQTAVFAISGHDWAPPGWTSNHLDQFARWTNTASGTQVSGPAGGEAYSLRAGTTLNCVGAGGTGDAGAWEALRAGFGTENSAANIREAIGAGIFSEDVIDRDLVRVFTLRMRLGEFDPVAQQRYTKITRKAIEAPAHRVLAQRVGDEALTLLQNHRKLLPAVAPQRVVIIGDQAGKVFLGGYSGSPSEQVSLLDGFRRELPNAHLTYDDGNSSSTSTDAPSLSAGTQAAIKVADLVVVMVGTDAGTNAEGSDRKSLAMPGNYGALIDQVAAVGNRKIALVVQSAGPIDLGAARGKVAAILYSAANGQRQGLAAADALLGKVDPAGHLSFTWFRNDAQLPPISNYNLVPAKTGGLGRTYMYFTGKPSYPFGYGRSYTRFRYSHVRVARRRIAAGGTERVSFRVRNAGRRAGATVAQLYATPPSGPLLRKLVGFRRTRVLAPGRSQRITIAVPLVSSLRHWDGTREVVEPGVWHFALARSATAPVRTLTVRVRGRIPGTIKTLTVEPAQLSIARGTPVDLLARNPWLEGLAPTGQPGDQIITAVRADDSFADPARIGLTFSSDRPDVATVDTAGQVHAVSPGVATITVRHGRVRASAPFVVR